MACAKLWPGWIIIIKIRIQLMITRFKLWVYKPVCAMYPWSPGRLCLYSISCFLLPPLIVLITTGDRPLTMEHCLWLTGVSVESRMIGMTFKLYMKNLILIMVYELPNIVKIYDAFIWKNTDAIRSPFCTCYDSWAAMVCAKIVTWLHHWNQN